MLGGSIRAAQDRTGPAEPGRARPSVGRVDPDPGRWWSALWQYTPLLHGDALPPVRQRAPLQDHEMIRTREAIEFPVSILHVAAGVSAGPAFTGAGPAGSPTLPVGRPAWTQCQCRRGQAVSAGYSHHSSRLAQSAEESRSPLKLMGHPDCGESSATIMPVVLVGRSSFSITYTRLCKSWWQAGAGAPGQGTSTTRCRRRWSRRATADFCLRSQRSYAMGAEISGLVDPDSHVSQGVNRLICCAPKKGPGKNSNSEYEVRYIA